MIKRYIVTSTRWTAISTAGQSGSAWIERNVKGDGQVLISHASSGTPKSFGYRLHVQSGNNQHIEFVADNSNDILYARVLVPGNEVNIVVDAI